jgi:hypothetical protein
MDASFSESEIMKGVLEPLFDDFDDWLGRSRSLLESEQMPFLTPDQQADYLVRIREALQSVSTSRSLFNLTNGTVGVEPQLLLGWHQLVMECWQIATRFHQGETPK